MKEIQNICSGDAVTLKLLSVAIDFE